MADYACFLVPVPPALEDYEYLYGFTARLKDHQPKLRHQTGLSNTRTLPPDPLLESAGRRGGRSE